MARRRWRRFMLAVMGAAAAAALLWVWWTGLSARFDAAGLTIDPRARIDPERRYDLLVWEETIPIPWASATHRDVLARAVAAFEERWPQARVLWHLLDPAEARNRLAAAVAAGRPPDVYGSRQGLVLFPSHQIPAGPYVPGTEPGQPPLFAPAARAGVTHGNQVWGWPRGLWWQAWLADRELFARGGIDPQVLLSRGWTWEEFTEWASRLRGVVDHPLVLDTTAVATLEHLILNGGAPAFPAPPDDAGWSPELVLRVAGFLQDLVHQGALPKDAAAASRTRLERLLTGRAAVVGPVNPYVVQSVLRREPDRYRLVPIPHHGAAPEAAPMETSAYFVFRQDPYQGDDHTRLSMELAHWLAQQTETWLVQNLGVLPARTAALPDWQANAPLDDDSKAFLVDYMQQGAHGGQAAPADDLERLRERLHSPWQAFWEGTLSGEGLAEALRRELDGALSPAPSR